MGCVCCSLSSFISIVLHALERITLCTVCAMLVCCVLFTVLAVLIMGVGIGFHYCEVQNAVEAMANAAKAASALDESRRSGGIQGQQHKVLRSVNTAVKRGFAHRLGRRDRADQRMPSNNNTINDLILAGNVTAGSRRKRDLDLTNKLDKPINHTAFTNNSLNYDYEEDLKSSSDNETLANVEEDASATNISIHDATLLRQNCTLLNFFSHFLHI